MLITQFLDSVTDSTFLSVTEDTVNNLFHKNDLQLLMIIYTASPLLSLIVKSVIDEVIN